MAAGMTDTATLRQRLIDAARKITYERLRHYGFTEEQIALVEQPREHTDECELTEHGWECFDEDLRPFHPEHNEADATAEFVMFVLEHTDAVVVAFLRDQAAGGKSLNAVATIIADGEKPDLYTDEAVAVLRFLADSIEAGDL